MTCTLRALRSLILALTAIVTFAAPAPLLARTVPLGIAGDSLCQARPRTSTTKGSVTVAGHRIDYDAVAGTVVLGDRDGKPTGAMFYVAYFKSGEAAARRPITFLYNGGPGGSSGDLHIAGFGPVRVMTDDGTYTPPPPYAVGNNPDSLLDASDLVFVDAIGTGFSCILDKDRGGVGGPANFYGVDPDARSFAQFIGRFLSAHSRWNSPRFLVGESYGTTRSAVLANMLEQDNGIDLNGVVLLSSNLNFATDINQAGANPGLNLPYVLALPTYAAIASNDQRVSEATADLRAWLDEVQDWAMGPYLQALDAGNTLPQSRKEAIAAQLSRYTSLPPADLLKANLRISNVLFEQRLLPGRVVGRMDGRVAGPPMAPLGETIDYDPAIAAISSAYTSALNAYLRDTLHVGGGDRYIYLSLDINGQWDFLHTLPGQSGPSYTSTNSLADLAAAMTINPHLKVMFNAGYYDLATPYFAATYQLRQLPVAAGVYANVEYHYYNAGHMIYADPRARGQLHQNIVDFIHANAWSYRTMGGAAWTNPEISFSPATRPEFRKRQSSDGGT